MKKRYSLTEEQCQCMLIDFFDNVARLMGVTDDISKLRYDCRKICVTKLVQDHIWKYYSYAGNSSEHIATIWSIYGPKANLEGESLEVEIEDGFIIRG